MIKTKQLFWMLPCMLAGAIILAQTTAEPTFLVRRDLKEGTVSDYKLAFNVKYTVTSDAIGGDQEFTIGGTLKYSDKAGKYDKEKKLLDSEVAMTNMKFELGGLAVYAMQGMIDQMPKEYKLAGKVDDRNRWSADKPKADAKVDPKIGQMRMMIGMIGALWAQSLNFPEKPVKVSDTWDIILPKNPAYGDKEVKLAAKLVSEKKIDAVSALVITVDGVLPLSMDLSSMGSDAPEGVDQAGTKLTGPVKIHIEATIDKTTGRLIEMSVKSSGDQQLETPNQAPMKIKGDSTVKMTPWMTVEKTTETKPN